MQTDAQQRSSTAPLRAALYMRTSTTMQTLSPIIQATFLRDYAAAHGMQIVRVYQDLGKSGLVLSGRPGMQALLADIDNGAADYQVVLIYDVSRWGRFQNIDEAGAHEFACRQAGIQVLYCAEPSINDGTPLAQLGKSYRRTMAAEHSRDLSNKVFAGLRLLAQRGYKLGGSSMYGLRRVAVSADGLRVRELPLGERKPHPTWRVRQAPGSEQEISVVQRIFALYTRQGMGVRGIQQLLNAEGVPCGSGRWTDYKVDAILRSEHYWGTQVYNRTSLRLKSAFKRNPLSQWVRCEHALGQIVDPADGARAARVRSMRRGEGRREVLEEIQAVYAHHGKVNLSLLAEVPGMPRWARITRLFGSLGSAYAQAGVANPRSYPSGSRQPACVRCQEMLCKHVLELVALAGGRAQAVPGSVNEFVLNDGLVLRVVVRPCQPTRGILRWLVPVHLSRHADFVLAGLLDPDAGQIGRYALIDTGSEARPIVRFGRDFYPPSAKVVHKLPVLFGVTRTDIS